MQKIINLILKKQSGFSLIQVMGLAVLLGAASLSSMYYSNSLKNNQAIATTKLEEMELFRVITETLSDNVACSNTFNSINLGSTFTTIKNNTNTDIYSINGVYGNGTLKIINLQTVDNNQLTPDGKRKATLSISIQKLKMPASTGLRVLSIPIQVTAANATALITNCVGNINEIISSAIAEENCLFLAGVWDSATKSCSLNNFLLKTGGTMTGNLSAPLFSGALTGNVTGNMGPAPSAVMGTITGNLTGTFTSGIVQAINATFTSDVATTIFAGAKFNSNNMCDLVGTNCKNPGLLLYGQACALNNYLTGVVAGTPPTPACVAIPFATCAANEYIQTVQANGQPVCAALATSASSMCGAGQVITAIDATGVPNCVPAYTDPYWQFKSSTSGWNLYSNGTVSIGATNGNTKVEPLHGLYIGNDFNPQGAVNPFTKFSSYAALPLSSLIGASIDHKVNDAGSLSMNDTSAVTINTTTDQNLTGTSSLTGASIDAKAIEYAKSLTGSKFDATLVTTKKTITTKGLVVENAMTAGTATNVYGIKTYGNYVNSPNVTNRYGLYIASPTGVPVFDAGKYDYGLFTEAPGTETYLSAKIGIGTIAPTYRAHVVGDINTSTCLRSVSAIPWVAGVCSSDIRLKKNVTSFNQGLESLLNIKPRYFRYNGLGGHPVSQEKEIGVIAQEIEPFFPELITTKNVKLHPDDSIKTPIKQVSYGIFPYISLNSIKQLYTQWMAQQNNFNQRLSNLQEKIKQLQSEEKNLLHESIKLNQESLAIKNKFCLKNDKAELCH